MCDICPTKHDSDNTVENQRNQTKANGPGKDSALERFIMVLIRNPLNRQRVKTLVTTNTKDVLNIPSFNSPRESIPDTKKPENRFAFAFRLTLPSCHMIRVHSNPSDQVAAGS